MKKLLNTFTLVGLLITTIAFGQLDQQKTINYQGVARDASNEVLSNETIDIRIAVRFGAPNATIKYAENHSVTTNKNGVFNLQIGSGVPVAGAFNTLIWGDLAPYATVMINGSNAGTVQIHSVPYANASGRATQMVLNDLINVEGAPTTGQVLKFNGSNWAPGVDQTGGGGGEVYTAGDGIAISTGNEISAVLGTSIESSEIEDSAVTTNKIADNSVTGEKIAPMAAANGQVLKYDGTDWTPANDDGQVYNAGDGIAINGSTIEATLGTSIETSEIENNSVTGEKIAPMAAASGQVLKYDGTTWSPANDNTGGGGGTVYTAGDGISISGTDVISADLGTDIETSELQDNSVTGDKIAPMAAANGQVLKYDGTDWTPANDNGEVYTAGNGIILNGNNIQATLGTSIATAEIEDNAVTGDKIAPMAATNGQVLKYDGTDWIPANDNGEIYTAGDGIILSGNDIQATLGTSIETAEIEDNAVTGDKIAPMAATNGQVLTYDGNDWLPADAATTGGANSIDDLSDGKVVGFSTYLGEGAGVSTSNTGDNNTALGVNALFSNTTGGNNTAIGKDALYSNTTGIRNVANGVNSLFLNTTGYDNVAIGESAMLFNTTGYENVANGHNALIYNSTGYRNVANGKDALYSNKTGSENSANGSQALFANSTGNGNVANGHIALYFNTTGNYNVANGHSALHMNTTGNNNVANGSEALYSNTTGNFNVATGKDALYSNTTGSDNVANGAEALYSNSTGTRNIATGYRALKNNTTGNNNVANGWVALLLNTTGNNNVANGYAALRSNTTGVDNVASGTEALYSNTTGEFNVASGSLALASNTIGDKNIANGNRALFSNTTGSENIANGFEALFSNTTGFQNVANGHRALYSNTVGNNNVANGAGALYSSTTGNSNVAMGRDALLSNTTGNINVAIGRSALFNNTTGEGNVANGTEALFSNITGYENVANGWKALYFNTSGIRNVANGNRALYFNTTGSFNNAIGRGALNSNTTGDYNVAIGDGALVGITTGNNNVGFGKSTLFSNTTGSGNVAIGHEAGYNETGSNKLYISNSNTNTPLIYGEFDNNLVRINGSFAMGSQTSANGSYSTAMGYGTTANGENSTAMGFLTYAAGELSIAMGKQTIVQGDNSTAIGSLVTLEGNGSIYLADNSSRPHDVRYSNNTFFGRFANGYYLYTDATDNNLGVRLAGGANSWSTISDRNKKENIEIVEGNYFIESIKKMELGSWNYIGQDSKEFRHWGPMAQDMYKYFGKDGIGTIGNDTTIATADIDGVMMIAIQQLARENDSIKNDNNNLRDELLALKKDLRNQKIALQQQKQNLENKIETYAEEKVVLEAKVDDFNVMKSEMEERLSKIEGMIQNKITEKQYSKL